MNMERKFIGLRPAEFNSLTAAKNAYEKKNGSNTDWGAFFMLLLGLAAGTSLFNEWMKNNDRPKNDKKRYDNERHY